MTLWIFVVVRIVANPFSNLFQKLLTRKGAGPLFIICATHGVLSLGCLPLLWALRPELGPGFWVDISVSAVLAVAGNAMIVQALSLSDLSVLGPINAYKSVVSLVPGLLLLHEIPGRAGIAGIGLIVAGSYCLVEKGDRSRNVFLRFFDDRGIQFRLAALVFSAVEAVFLKRALLASSPVAAFAIWAILGFGVSLIAVAAARGKRLRREIAVLNERALPYLMLGLTTALMQLCTLLTFKAMQVGYALALFQSSALITVLLGHTFFRERHFPRRLIGSFVMAAGAVLIISS